MNSDAMIRIIDSLRKIHRKLKMFNKKYLSYKENKKVKAISFFGIVLKLKNNNYLLSKETYEIYLNKKIANNTIKIFH